LEGEFLDLEDPFGTGRIDNISMGLKDKVIPVLT
jgi:hypothetical protein